MDVKYDERGSAYVMWGNNKVQIEKAPVTDKRYLEKAEKELRETPEVTKKALDELRQLLKGETSLAVPIDDDAFLLTFLRPCKFYADSAFKKIKSYYKFRVTYSDYCRDLLPSATKIAFEHNILSMLAPRDQHGRRIILVESGERWNPRDVSLQDLFRAMMVGLEAIMMEPQTQICGTVWIFDMKGLYMSQILQYTPSYAKMVIELIQECVPVRVKEIHVVFQPYIFKLLFAIFKPFMREKLRSRIFFHGGNLEPLKKSMGTDALRQRHGGSLPEPEISNLAVWQMFHHHEEDYKLGSSYGYENNNNTKI